ncbi:MAG: NAD-dependent epimerase/dehydratase family protein [Chlamydiae bacterium]|nr:NAD-dependent epimerase/dehydratase family protein [Chlamydiota bacterium]
MSLHHEDLIVITGGAGFIAKYVIEELNRQNFTHLVLFERYDALTKEHFENLKGLKFSSLESSESIESFLEIHKDEIRCVIHLGANASTTGTDPQDYLLNNYELSKFLAAFCIEEKIRFIYASSASIYGDGTKGFEDDLGSFKTYRPLNLYAWSKYLFDQYIYENNLQENVLGLRLFNIFGADRSKGDMQCIVTKAFDKMLSKKKMEIFDVESQRDFVYVRDVAKFIVESISKQSYGIFNFGTGIATPFRDVCDMVFKAMGHVMQFDLIALPTHLVGKYQFLTKSSTTRFDKMLKTYGYKFSFSNLEDGINDTVLELKKAYDP